MISKGFPRVVLHRAGRLSEPPLPGDGQGNLSERICPYNYIQTCTYNQGHYFIILLIRHG